ncbi:hypothetical protein [Qipengyuania sediminis]|uniref:hypothetical protein n=1 Tax=Qipengyuania sediminis TaxID=1532023 RepID=UPI00105A741E|nr:hypothetical protein [Qipengyuania sediminis]
MSGFTLPQKLGVAGAFLLLVALAVGTEDEPGFVVAGTSDLAIRRTALASAGASSVKPASSVQPSSPASVQAAPVGEPIGASAPLPAIAMQPPVDPQGPLAPQIDLPAVPETGPPR